MVLDHTGLELFFFVQGKRLEVVLVSPKKQFWDHARISTAYQGNMPKQNNCLTPKPQRQANDKVNTLKRKEKKHDTDKSACPSSLPRPFWQVLLCDHAQQSRPEYRYCDWADWTSSCLAVWTGVHSRAML